MSVHDDMDEGAGDRTPSLWYLRALKFLRCRSTNGCIAARMATAAVMRLRRSAEDKQSGTSIKVFGVSSQPAFHSFTSSTSKRSTFVMTSDTIRLVLLQVHIYAPISNEFLNIIFCSLTRF